MPREYVPVPIEYLAEMEPLSDENFGRLIRALLRYGSDGTPIDLDGDCRCVLEKHFLQGKSYTVIGLEMGYTKRNVLYIKNLALSQIKIPEQPK